MQAATLSPIPSISDPNRSIETLALSKMPQIVELSGRIFQLDQITWGNRNPKDIERFLSHIKRGEDWLVYQDIKTQETWLSTFKQGEIHKVNLTKGQLPPPGLKDPLLPLTFHQHFVDLKDARILSPDVITKKLIKQRLDAEEAQVLQQNNPFFSQLMISRKKVNYEYTSTKGDPEELKTMPKPVQVLDMSVGIASCKGKRPKMEDAHVAKEITLDIAGKEHKAALFGVFDGHRGSSCARFLVHNLEKSLKARMADLTDAGISAAFQLAFHDLKKKFLELCDRSGSTATVVLVLPKEDGSKDTFCANAGDSRAFIEDNGNALALSMDAKPFFKKFQKGIIARGGVVIEGRVMGKLAVARGFEGCPLVVGSVSARPKIIKRTIYPGATKKRLFIACDGMFDVCSSAQVAKHLPFMHEANLLPCQMAEHLLRAAWAAESKDNITAMVVDLC